MTDRSEIPPAGGPVDLDGCVRRTVENARIYSLPAESPPIYVAASGEGSGELAARVGDGLITTAPDRALVELMEASDRPGRPKVAQATVCWAADEPSARRTALEWWPTSAIRGEASQELPLPRHFEQIAQMVTEDQISEAIVCGPDPERHVRKLQEFADAGMTHVYVHQVGPDQAGFMEFYRTEILPRMR